MSRKRIIQNDEHKFVIQVYDEKFGWDYLEYCETINMLGSEVECHPYPKTYTTYDEALSKINVYDELITD